MSDENKVNDTELSRISQELATTRLKLDDERRKREEDLNRRLDDLHSGQNKILEQIGEVKLTYATAVKLDKLETRVDSQQKLIYIATGALLTIEFAVPILLHFWK